MAERRHGEEETSTGYLWKRGGRAIGPFSIADMRRMVRSGELGRTQSVSCDGGATWTLASELGELWKSTEIVTFSGKPPEPPAAHVTTPQATIIVPPHAVIEGVETGVAPSRPVAGRSGWGLGLAGFITGTAALTLVLVPLGIWFSRYEAGYGFVPLSAPLLAASITGLVLSAIAMFRGSGGFATAGLVVGICGVVLGLTTIIGWGVSQDPREDWIRRLTATADADLQLARKDFTSSLQTYRDRKPNTDPVAARQRLTKHMLTLAEAHKRLLIAAASTPWFRRHFADLSRLHTAYAAFSESIKLQDNLTPLEAIDDAGRDSSTLRDLLDLNDLYRTGGLALESAQAKFRDY